MAFASEAVRAEGAHISTSPTPVTLKDALAARKGRALNRALRLLNALENSQNAPKNIQWLKAQTQRQMMCWSDAAITLRRRVLEAPGDTKARLALIDVARSLGKFDEAQAHLLQDGSLDMAVAGIKIALGQGDNFAALSLSEAAFETWADDKNVLLTRCGVLLEHLRYREADLLLERALQDSPQDQVLRVRRAEIALAQNDFARAEPLVLGALPSLRAVQLLQRLDDVRGLGRARSDGQINAQLARLQRAYEDAEGDSGTACQTHLDMGDLLFLKNDWRAALHHYQLADADAGQNRLRSLKVARCHYRLLDFKACRATLERLLEQAPGLADAEVLRASVDLMTGDVAAYLRTFALLFETPGPRQMVYGTQLMRAHLRAGQVLPAKKVEAEVMVLARTRFEPEFIAYLLQFSTPKRAFEACLPWAARAFAEGVHIALLQEVEAAHGQSFDCEAVPVVAAPRVPKGDTCDIAAMADLGARKIGPATDLPVPVSLQVAWDVSAHQALGFETWQSLARQATQNIRRVSLLAPTRQDIEPFADIPEKSALGPYADHNDPIVFLSCHAGPAVACALDDTLLAGRDSAYLRSHGIDERQRDRLIEVGHDPQSAAKAVVKALAAGKSIGMVVDSPTLWQSGGRSETGARGKIFGVDVVISATPLKLAQAFNTPMMWLQPIWRDGRIVFEIEEMDVPGQDIPFQQAADLWAKDYLARVERVMRSGPENQDLSAPMWQHLVYHGFGKRAR